MLNGKVIDRIFAVVHRGSKFAAGQGVAQLLGLIAGFLIVRFLSVNDYALYALFGAIVGITGTTCDLGVGGALVAFTGKARTSAERAATISSVDNLRRWFTTASVIGAAVLLVCHPVPREAGAPVVVGLVVLAIAVVAVQSRNVFYQMLAAVDGQHRQINRASIFSATFRLALVAPLFLFTTWLALWFALVAWLLAAWLMFLLIRTNHPTQCASADTTMRVAILRYARPLWLGHVYWVVQSVLPLFALGIAAGAGALAELGALGRLTQVTVFVTPVTVYILMPWISRGAFATRAAAGLAWLLLIGVALTLSGWIFADQYLWILGASYAHLGHFVPIALGLASLTLISGGCYQFLLAGGHTSYLWIATMAGIAAQAVMVTYFPIYDLPSAYAFLALTAGAPLLVHLGLVIRAITLSVVDERALEAEPGR